MSAGKILNWNLSLYGSPGFGVNKSIIRYVIQNKLNLLIKHDSGSQKEFWLSHDHIRDFMKHNNTEYKVKTKFVHVLPWKLFHSKPYFSGDQE